MSACASVQTLGTEAGDGMSGSVLDAPDRLNQTNRTLLFLNPRSAFGATFLKHWCGTWLGQMGPRTALLEALKGSVEHSWNTFRRFGHLLSL